MNQVDHLRIPLQQILTATDNFNVQNLIGNGGYGKVYSGKIFRSSTGTGTSTSTSTGGEYVAVAVKRSIPDHGQGQKEFQTEITTLSNCKHYNLISLVGFCDEGGEWILVYDFANHASLDKYLLPNKSSNKLTWKQRLKICIGAARGLDYLHNGVGPGHRIIHRDVKSSNILLDENWEAKLSDFGLSRLGPVNQVVTFCATNVAGTPGYWDPQYIKTGILTKESDIYSFGVILFEVLCGRLAFQPKGEDEQKDLVQLARSHFQQKRLYKIIDPSIKESISNQSLNIFSTIAYQCLQDDGKERPTMNLIVKELESALYHQETWMDMKESMESGERLIIYARQIDIDWVNNESYWTWNHIQDYDGQSIEVAKLSEVCWLHMISRYTIPDSYQGIECEIAFDVKLEEDSSGWEEPITLKLSHPHGDEIQVQEQQICISDKPKEQWMELHVGNFNVEKGENKEVCFQLYQIGDHWKRGLIVKRIIIRKIISNCSYRQRLVSSVLLIYGSQFQFITILLILLCSLFVAYIYY